MTKDKDMIGRVSYVTDDRGDRCGCHHRHEPDVTLDAADPELVAAIKEYAAAPRKARRMTPAQVLRFLRQKP